MITDTKRRNQLLRRISRMPEDKLKELDDFVSKLEQGVSKKSRTLSFAGCWKDIEDSVSENIVIPMTENSAKISAELYSTLRQSGNLVDDIDLLIAGIAIDNEMSLLTNNENHFSRIPGLKIENWSNE